MTTVKAVALLFGLHRHTIKEIDREALAKVQAERPLDGITVMGVDEIGVGKGHHDWTLLSALEGPRGPEMLYVVQGRSEKRLKRFWRWFGKERTAEITHAVMDMCRAFQKAELGRALGRFKKTLSGKKFVLMARRARVRGRAREALDAVLAASPRLAKAHVLKESFVHLWDYTYKGCAMRFWQEWKAKAQVEPAHVVSALREVGRASLGRHPDFLRQEGLAGLHRVQQPQGPQRHPQGLRLPGQGLHEAQGHPSLHPMDGSVQALDGSPQFSAMSPI